MVSRAVRPADATVEGGRQKGNLLATGSVVSIFTVAKHLGISATGEDGARDVNPRLSKAPLKSFPPPSARQAPVPAGRDRRSAAVKEGACWSPSRALLRSGPRGPDARRIVEGRIRRTVRLRRGGAGSRCRPGLRPGGFLRGTTSARSRECLPGSVQGSLPRPPE